MKKTAILLGSMAVVVIASSANAEVSYFNGPEPSTTYTVCNHDALFARNNRAHLVRAGGRTFVDSGSTVTIGRDPDIFMQSEHLVRHSFRSLSASGHCE